MIFPVVFLLNDIHPFLFVVALNLLHALSELLKVVFLERAVHSRLPLQPHVHFTTLGDALLQGLTANPEQCQGATMAPHHYFVQLCCPTPIPDPVHQMPSLVEGEK